MKKVFLLILSLILVLFLTSCINPNYETNTNPNNSTGNNQQSNYTQTRKAKNSDIGNVNMVFPTTRSITITFIPETDISQLFVKLILKDSDGNTIDSQIIEVGNVIEGQMYTLQHTIQTNDINKNKKISTSELSVHSGSVTYSTAPGIYFN